MAATALESPAPASPENLLGAAPVLQNDPQWTRARTLELGAEGCRLEPVAAWGRTLPVAEVPWEAVLGGMVEGKYFYLLVARKPPEAPWFRVPLRGLKVEVEQLRRTIWERARFAGYRAQAGRSRLSAELLLGRALSREEIPGALEVPLAGRLVPWRWSGRRPGRRAVLLAPDGCVIGFPDGVRAATWSELAPFELGAWPGKKHWLVVKSRNGAVFGSLNLKWIAAPAQMVLEVETAYRRLAGC